MILCLQNDILVHRLQELSGEHDSRTQGCPSMEAVQPHGETDGRQLSFHPRPLTGMELIT